MVRLAEYLEATIVEVEKTVSAEVMLTPGVAVSEFVIHTIDTDADGTISTAEGKAYAAGVLEDLKLTVDGRRLGLQVTGGAVPRDERCEKEQAKFNSALAAAAAT